MTLTVNLGTPYEAIIENLIRKGYAGTQAEAIRHALEFYERYIEEEEVRLVNKGIEYAMDRIESGEAKTYSLEEVRKRQAKKRGL